MNQFVLLLGGHALGDYAFQNDFVSKFKSKASGSEMWPYVLISHGLIHGLMVYLVLGSIPLMLAETIVHCVTDHLKCMGKIGFHTDQWIHVGSKALWIIMKACLPNLL